MITLTVTIEFIEEVLGMTPGDPDLYRSYIATKIPTDLATNKRVEKISEEIQALEGTDAEDAIDEIMAKSMTVFPRHEEKPIAFDYQWKGYFKDICGALQKAGEDEMSKESLKIKAYKKVIDGDIMVFPRHIPFNVKGELGLCQRPLRADTAQGSRIALAISETIPAGSTMTFQVQCLGNKFTKAVVEWLNYGEFKGFGQWRNSSKGRFIVKKIETHEGRATMR